MSNLALGASGEDLAAGWYAAQGYEVVARNWRCREGELDLVVARGRAVVFCEVKTRRGHGFGLPAEAVKQRRMCGVPDGVTAREQADAEVGIAGRASVRSEAFFGSLAGSGCARRPLRGRPHGGARRAGSGR